MSKEDFQTQFSTVMDSAFRTAVSETTKLFETMVEELKAEISRIKSENEDLKAKFSCAKNVDDSLHARMNDSETAGSGQNLERPAINKRDVGIQCAFPTLRGLAGQRGFGGGVSDRQWDEDDQETGVRGDSNHQMAFILIKQETEYDDDYTPGYILLKQEDGPPTLIRRPDLREIPALLPSTLRALVGRNIPEWPPTGQPPSSEVAPTPQRAPELQEAPQTTCPSRNPIPSPGMEDQDLDLDQASGPEQQPEVGESERVEPLRIQQHRQPSVVEEQQQLTEATVNRSVVAQQPPVVAPPETTRPQVVAEEPQEVIPSGIEQLLAFAEQQQQEILKQQEQSTVVHPCATKLSTLPPPTSAEPVHFGIVELLKLAEHRKQSMAAPSVPESVDTPCRKTADVTAQRPTAARLAPTSDPSTSVSDASHSSTRVDSMSSTVTPARRSSRPLRTQAASTALTSSQLSEALQQSPTSPPQQVMVTRQTRARPHGQQPSVAVQTSVESPRQPAGAVCRTTVSMLGQQAKTVGQTVSSPGQLALAMSQTTPMPLAGTVGKTICPPRKPATCVAQTTVGSPRQPVVTLAQTRVGSPRAVATAQTIVETPGQLAISIAQTVISPMQHPCTVGETSVGSPRQQNTVMGQTTVRSPRQQPTVTGERAVGLPKQQPLPARIIVVSPKYRSMVTGQTTAASSMHTSTAVSQLATGSSKQQQGVPQRIVVLSPRHQSLVTGQVNEHTQPAAGVASGQPAVTSRAVTVATSSPLVVPTWSTSLAELSAAVTVPSLKLPHLSNEHGQTPPAPSTTPSATEKIPVGLLRLTNLVSKKTTPDPPGHLSKNQFLAQLAVLPIQVQAEPAIDQSSVLTPALSPILDKDPACVLPVSSQAQATVPTLASAHAQATVPAPLSARAQATDPPLGPAPALAPPQASAPPPASGPAPALAPIPGPVVVPVPASPDPVSASPDPVPDPLQMDLEDVGEASPLSVFSTETTETRTVATETSPVDTKEGARRPSSSVKESLFARLKTCLRPRRPQPGVTETDSSQSSPKKPRMSKAANQPKATSNTAGQSGRVNRAVTPPRQVESLKSSTPMTTRGRSTAQLEKAPESTSKTLTATQRSPLNGSSFSGTPQHYSPSTPPPTTSRSSHRCSSPSPRSPTARSITLRHVAKTPPQPHTPDKELPQDESNSPGQPLQRIGNRLLKNQCGACGRVLSSAAALESHVSQHTGDRPFFCTLCGKGFPDAKGLNRHGRVHSGESHECPQCRKTFTYRFGLTKHLQMVHGHLRPFTCQVCSKGFFTQRDVEAHLRVHTGEKPFHCTLCEKKFKRKVELNVHLRWHNGEKRHWCPFCGKGFLDYNNLKRHKLIHTGEKPHRCPQCGKTFTQSGHLKKHLKNVHRVGEGHQG